MVSSLRTATVRCSVCARIRAFVFRVAAQQPREPDRPPAALRLLVGSLRAARSGGQLRGALGIRGATPQVVCRYKGAIAERNVVGRSKSNSLCFSSQLLLCFTGCPSEYSWLRTASSWVPSLRSWSCPRVQSWETRLRLPFPLLSPVPYS